MKTGIFGAAASAAVASLMTSFVAAPKHHQARPGEGKKQRRGKMIGASTDYRCKKLPFGTPKEVLVLAHRQKMAFKKAMRGVGQ